MNKVISIFKSKSTQSNSFECFFSSGKTFNSEYKNSKNPYKPNKSAVLKEKLHLSTISYTYLQLVTLFDCKAVYLPNLINTHKYLKPYWNGNSSQKQTISICKKLPLSTISYPLSIISYPYQQLVTLFQQLVTLLPTINYLLSTISYPWSSISSTATVKMVNFLKLLKLKEKLVINKWGFL